MREFAEFKSDVVGVVFCRGFCGFMQRSVVVNRGAVVADCVVNVVSEQPLFVVSKSTPGFATLFSDGWALLVQGRSSGASRSRMVSRRRMR